MPTLFKYNGYRFYFYSNEHLPKHIHIENGNGYARIELDTLDITDNYNFKSKELKLIVKLVKEHGMSTLNNKILIKSVGLIQV